MELCPNCAGTGRNGTCDACGGSGFFGTHSGEPGFRSTRTYAIQPSVPVATKRVSGSPNPDYNIPLIKLPKLTAPGHLVTMPSTQRKVAVTTIPVRKPRKGVSPTQKIKLSPSPVGKTTRIAKTKRAKVGNKMHAAAAPVPQESKSTFEALLARSETRAPNLDGAKEWGAYRDAESGQFGSYPAFDPPDSPDD